MTELDKLIRDLSQPGMALQLAALAGCLVLAFGLSWLAGRRRVGDSVWFGSSTVDGLLFPLLALALTSGARSALEQFQRTPLLKVAIPILISLAGIRLIARVLTAVFPESGAARLAERLFSWLAWLAAVLWIVGLLPQLLDEMGEVRLAFGKSRVSLLDIVQGVLSSGLVLVLALWLSSAIERRILHDAVQDRSMRKIAANAMRALLLLVGMLFALSAVGVDLTALSVLGGALGVGLGFGLQKLAANYVSGFVILFERSLRIGDTVKVDGFEGEVVDIKTRYTLVRGVTGRDSIVPNEKLITERIENLSLADRKLLLNIEVTVGYDSDVEAVQRILHDAASGCERVLAEPAPGAHLLRLGEDGLEFSLYFWIDDPRQGRINVQSQVNIRVLQGLRAAGIDIPYPQRVVRLVPPASSVPAVAAVGSAGLPDRTVG
ncbi:MAG: mechanosensitive ion channel [Burkholderiaceae bacterium]|nr:mechanosensitive ion channel [Burkholderiaceae bacterium]